MKWISDTDTHLFHATGRAQALLSVVIRRIGGRGSHPEHYPGP